MKKQEGTKKATAAERANTPPPSAAHPTCATPGASTAQAVTEDSTCDYVVYTVRRHASDEGVVAVLIGKNYKTPTVFTCHSPGDCLSSVVAKLCRWAGCLCTLILALINI